MYDWPGKARVALSIVVNVEEGSEYNVGEGDRITEPVDELNVQLKKPIRNYGNESNYRYGLGPGHARVARLLDQYAVPATYTAAALSLERAPHIADYIRERGHEPCCHGYRWVHQFSFDEARERPALNARLAPGRAVGYPVICTRRTPADCSRRLAVSITWMTIQPMRHFGVRLRGIPSRWSLFRISWIRMT
jgi:peptidoglycan/xylan/chitin deacetylase (PgdA/CDA1 family)